MRVKDKSKKVVVKREKFEIKNKLNKHKENIKRLLSGTENKLSVAKK